MQGGGAAVTAAVTAVAATGAMASIGII